MAEQAAVSIHLREWGALHLWQTTRPSTWEVVSIHLREWGALHPTILGLLIKGRDKVSIHLREWGALHLNAIQVGKAWVGFNSPS